MIRSKKITQSAKGEECAMNCPDVCNHNPETTVWAHSNLGEDGKGMGIKAHDIFGAYLCSNCHDWYDRRTNRYYCLEDDEGREDYFERAMKRSWLRLIEKGIISIK